MDSNTIAISAIVLAATVALLFLQNKNSAPKFNTVLIKDQFQEFPLIEKTVLSPSTAIYKFKLPHENDKLGLPIGQHITIKHFDAENDNKEILRHYTPVSLDEESSGYFDLLIKTYPQGKVSSMFAQLAIGDTIKVRGPKGFYKYEPNMLKHIAMVAGGTGITPMFQILKAIYNNPKDKTKVTLIFGNANEADILLRTELDEIIQSRPDQFKIHYILDKKPEVDDSWVTHIGYITEELLREKIPSGDEPDVQLLICGPPGMVSATKRYAQALKYPRAKPVSKMEDKVFCF